MKRFLEEAASHTTAALNESIETCAENLHKLADSVVSSLKRDGKVLIFGNGGSAADAQHIAAEFVNRFRMNRRPLAAMALTTDTSILTSISNDFDYDEIFSKQVEALAGKDDIVIGISTSGNSANVLKGLEAARDRGAVTAGFTGSRPGKMGSLCDIIINVASTDTPRIQEVHIFMAHCLCEIVEREMFS